MPVLRRVSRLLRDPVGVARRRAAFRLAPRRYGSPDGYDAQRFWTDRLAQHGFDLRGVGLDHLTSRENEVEYAAARETFLRLCDEESVDLSSARIIEVGCGTGFYAGVCRDRGATSYLGLDITGVLFPGLRSRFPDFEFEIVDVCSQPIGRRADVLIMIDVTQHITSEEKFTAAMHNLDSCLSDGGVILVTSWLDENAVRSFVEVSRGIGSYRREFPGYRFGDPVVFRDKFLFSIRKPGAP